MEANNWSLARRTGIILIVNIRLGIEPEGFGRYLHQGKFFQIAVRPQSYNGPLGFLPIDGILWGIMVVSANPTISPSN